MRRLFLTVFVAAFAAAALLAADFWTTKEFAEWNDKEIKRILTNSPWAKTQDITTGARLPSGGGGRRGGGGGGGGGRPGGGGGGEGGGGGQSMSMPSMRVYLRWISALPVRQAMVRQQYGDEINSPEAQKFLTAPDDRHILVIVGMPVNMAGSRGGSGGGRGRGEPGQPPDPADFQKRATENLMANATLKIKGKEPVHPAQVQVSGTQEEPQIYMAFPSAKDGGFEIVLEDKDVEFLLKLRTGNTLRRKFRLQDMVYNGKLEI